MSEKWEYKIIFQQMSGIEEVEKILTSLGAEGWELVSAFSSTYFVFKRRIS